MKASQHSSYTTYLRTLRKLTFVQLLPRMHSVPTFSTEPKCNLITLQSYCLKKNHYNSKTCTPALIPAVFFVCFSIILCSQLEFPSSTLMWTVQLGVFFFFFKSRQKIKVTFFCFAATLCKSSTPTGDVEVGVRPEKNQFTEEPVEEHYCRLLNQQQATVRKPASDFELLTNFVASIQAMCRIRSVVFCVLHVKETNPSDVFLDLPHQFYAFPAVVAIAAQVPVQ